MKTLSDKIVKIDDWISPSIYVEDVKQFIKEMDDWCEHIGRTTLITAETFMEILKERAGDKLIEEKKE